jgi:hypothetical protein
MNWLEQQKYIATRDALATLIFRLAMFAAAVRFIFWGA